MKLAFIDVETTGSSPVYDRVIEVGILRVEDNQVVSTYQTLINPETYLSPYITQITGIRTEDLLDAPTFSRVKDDIYSLLEGCTFVAHNARFDYGFIKNELRRSKMPFQAKTMCTVKLSRQLFPQYKRHSLDSLIERFNLSCENRHRAYDDAKIMWEFFQIIQNKFSQDKIQAAIDQVMRKTYLPPSLSPTILDDIPESPGVYIFYSEEGHPLYIGKSINMKDRVQSHFGTDLTSSRKLDMCQQIKSIKTIPTVGELGALLLESSLIKKLYPLYNRLLRTSSRLVIIKKKQEDNDYIRVSVETVDTIDPSELNSIVTISKSRRQAKEYLTYLAKEYHLCPKLLGLEKGPGSCFYHKLGSCFGACAGQESPLKYNLRCLEAFGGTEIRPWPYKGPVMIQEQDEFTNTHEGFIVDKWCYLGKIRWEGDIFQKDISNQYIFDFDMYKILSKFLRKSDYKKHIKPISLSELQIN